MGYSRNIFRFLALPLQIPDKARFHPYLGAKHKLHIIVLHSSEFVRPKILKYASISVLILNRFWNVYDFQIDVIL